MHIFTNDGDIDWKNDRRRNVLAGVPGLAKAAEAARGDRTNADIAAFLRTGDFAAPPPVETADRADADEADADEDVEVEEEQAEAEARRAAKVPPEIASAISNWWHDRKKPRE